MKKKHSSNATQLFILEIFSVENNYVLYSSDWKTFCSTGENPDHLVTTKENLNEELLQNSEKRDDLEMKVVQIVIYNHQKIKIQMDLN